jgi:predicted phosphoribosyltransferase
MYYKYISKNKNTYEVCERIEDDLEGKNIILIDEAVATGITFKTAINYCKYNKKVSVLYPVCVAFYNINNRKDLQIEYVLNANTLIWPWGYDN